MKQVWHISVDEVIESLNTSLTEGLSTGEVAQRQKQYGPNQLKEGKGRSRLSLFFDQFRGLIIWILIAAALISGFLREWVDSLAIIAIVILNAILGFIQEYRAEKSLAALKKLSSPTSRVTRDNERRVIPSNELVPGDLIELEAGDHIPADSRLVWLTTNLSVQEASLTGESTPVLKTIHALEEKDVPLADRANMIYMGTSVASGKARAIVIDTGMNTELGKIAGMIQDIVHESTPLQKKLEEFGRWIVYLCFVLVGLVFLLEWWRERKIIEVFLTSVSLAVAAIPEGLPAVVTIALALGVQRMVKRHALIRKLPSVETLGCATVICSDKTGTLTKNEMTAQAIYTGGQLFHVTGTGYEPQGEFIREGKPVAPDQESDLTGVLRCAVLCNGAELVREETGYKIIGDPTEGSLLTLAAKGEIWKEPMEREYEFLEEIPFDSERKMMTIVRKKKGILTAFVKGAPDVFVNECTAILEKGITRSMIPQDKQVILETNSYLAEQAMRVLAIGYRQIDSMPEMYQPDDIECNLTFVGLIAMMDPPRSEVKEAVFKCHQAGIKTVMITGDHKNTAVAIARELGFLSRDSLALTGEELDALSEEEFFRQLEQTVVYARVSPEHKLKIVRAWRKKGAIVAMTGDGVNDAPAVKEADIGVAMGITGTDVTKEVSEMVVTDDNFASIVAAVEEGRGIYDNIRKFVHYLLSCNTGEILVMFVSSLVGLPIPLLPIQILWVNLVTDGLPALALGMDPVDANIMQRPPRNTKEAVVTSKRVILMLIQGGFIAFCTLLAFCFVLFIEKEGLERARTAAFTVLVCSQLFHSFNCRHMRESIFRIGILTNKNLIAATISSFGFQMMMIYTPFFQKVFKIQALGFFDWVLVVLISSLPLWVMEFFKMVFKRIQSGQSPEKQTF